MNWVIAALMLIAAHGDTEPRWYNSERVFETEAACLEYLEKHRVRMTEALQAMDSHHVESELHCLYQSGGA